MAGERRGKVLEALVYLALAEGRREGEVIYWDQKHPGLKIRPDLLVCDEADRPTLLLQVTWSSTQEDLRPVKYWRDFAELNALRRDHGARALLITAEAASRRCRKLQRAAEVTWDQALCLADHPFGPPLVDAVAEALSRLGPGQGAVSFSSLVLCDLRRRRGLDDALDEALTALASHLEAPPEGEGLRGFWPALLSLQAARPRSAPVSLEDSFLRAGFAELVSFDAQERAELYRHFFEDAPLRAPPEHAELAGLVEGPTLRGFRLRSPALRWLLRFLGSPERAEALIDLDRTERSAYVESLRAAPEIARSLLAIARDLERYRDALALEVALEGGFDGELLRDGELPKDGQHWLFSGCKVLFAALGRGDWLGEVCAETGRLRSVLTGQLLPDLEQRRRRPEGALLRALARAFSRRLERVTPRQIEAATDEATDRGVRLLLRNRLQCHGVDPIRALLCEALPGARPLRLSSGLVEALRAERPELGFTANDLSTAGLVEGKTFLKWQSAYGGHNARHKAAELAGRVAHLSLGYRRRFEPRGEVDRFLLVLDGTWSPRDVSLLSKSGWDELLRPDQIGGLSGGAGG